MFHSFTLRKSWMITSGISRGAQGGVDLFFVVSGFIMLHTTRDKSGGRAAILFFIRRLLRVYPLYWLWSAGLLFLYVSGTALKNHTYSVSFVVCSFLLYPAWNGKDFHPMLNQGWTLSLEILFYAVFAVTFFIRNVFYKVCVVSLVLIALFGLTLIAPVPAGLKYLLSNALVLEFVLGMLAADCHWRLRSRVSHRPKAGWIIIVGGMVFFLLMASVDPLFRYRVLTIGVPAALVVFGASVLGGHVSRLLVWLGNASYSVYLVHSLLTLLSGRIIRQSSFLQHVQPDAYIAVSTVLFVLASSLTYPLLERPILRLVEYRTPHRERKS